MGALVVGVTDAISRRKTTISGDPDRPPPLLQAVRTTLGTLQTRARAYRWAVSCIGIVLLAPVTLALVWVTWRPLSFAALLVPVVGGFLVFDGWVMRSWQRRILEMWVRDTFALSDLRETLQGMRHLPAGTIAGMLDRLPPSERPQQLDRLSASAKSSLAARCVERTHRQDRRASLSTTGSTILACSLAAAPWIQVLVLVLIASVGLVLIVAAQWAGRREAP